jgi:hypothetical protein
MLALDNFILFIKYTIPQNQKGKSYAFKDFILHTVQTLTDPAQREDENDGKDNKSKASKLMLPTPQAHKQPPVMNPTINNSSLQPTACQAVLCSLWPYL